MNASDAPVGLRVWVLWLACAAFLPATLAAGGVEVFFDPAADFSSWRTFALEEAAIEGPAADPGRATAPEAVLRDLLAGGFESRGLAPADRATAALHVAYLLRLAAGGEALGTWEGDPWAEAKEIGTLVLVITDNESDREVWRGAVATGWTGGNPDRKRLQKAIAKLLKRFPPK